MSGFSLEYVSSNWKALKRKLATEKKSSSNGVKRKRASDESTNGYKRPKISKQKSAAFVKSRRMGNAHGSATISNDAADKPQSAGEALPTTTTAISQDVINCGATTAKVGKFVALDCEMVGTGEPPYLDHVLARASVVNYNGELVYDSFVLPPPGIVVKDYRTAVSGVTPENIKTGRPFGEVQKAVAGLLEGRILVGHALKNDLLVLELKHPRRDIRDTARYPKYRIDSRGKPPALRNLAKSELGLEIQVGEHSSVEDARAAMALFKKERAGFEEENRRTFGAAPPKARGAAAADVLAVSKTGGTATVEEEDSEDFDDDEDAAESDGGVAVKPTSSGTKKKRKRKKRTKRK